MGRGVTASGKLSDVKLCPIVTKNRELFIHMKLHFYVNHTDHAPVLSVILRYDAVFLRHFHLRLGVHRQKRIITRGRDYWTRYPDQSHRRSARRDDSSFLLETLLYHRLQRAETV